MKRFLQELDKLAVLIAVVEKGKINDAAEVLHLTQPSVTRAIQKLEEAFGVDIFIRSREGVKLTQAGRLLYQVSLRMVQELEDVQVRAKYIGHEIAGKLTIGSYESLAEYLWPDFLFKIQDLHPQLQLSVRTGLNTNPLSELQSGKIDLLVDAEPQTRGALISWPLYTDRFAFYASKKYRGDEFSIKSAANHTVTFVPGAFDEDRLTIENHLEKAGFKFSRSYFFDSFSTSKLLAIRGMAIAALPMRLAKEAEEKKWIKQVSLDGFNSIGFGRHTIYATVSAENEKDPRIRKVIALLKNHFK